MMTELERRGVDEPLNRHDTMFMNADFAELLIDAGDFHEAVPMLRESLEIAKATGTEGDEQCQDKRDRDELVGWAEGNLAKALALNGEHRAAATHYRACLRVRTRCFRPHHVLVTATVLALAEEVQKNGDLPVALSLLRRAAMSQRASADGPDDPSLARTLVSTALLLVRLARYEAARTVLEKALGILDRCDGVSEKDVDTVGTYLFRLERFLDRRSWEADCDKAEADARRAAGVAGVGGGKAGPGGGCPQS